MKITSCVSDRSLQACPAEYLLLSNVWQLECRQHGSLIGSIMAFLVLFSRGCTISIFSLLVIRKN